MDFTAGLMALEDALGQMLARITPLTDTETLPLHQAFGRWTFPVLIIRQWTAMRCAWAM